MDSNLTKVTVNLVPRAVRALDEAVTSEGYSKTDIINRAIQLYAFVVKKMAEGHELCLIDQGGEIHRLTLL